MHGSFPGSSGALLMLPPSLQPASPAAVTWGNTSEISEGSEGCFLCFYLSGQSVPSVLVFKQLQEQSPRGFHTRLLVGVMWTLPIGRFPQIHLSLLLEPVQSILRRLEIILTKKHVRIWARLAEISSTLLGFLFQNMTFAANVSDLVSLFFGNSDSWHS